MSSKFTFRWPAVAGAPGYDIYENGAKVSNVVQPQATFSASAGMTVEVKAQPAPTPPSLGWRYKR